MTKRNQIFVGDVREKLKELSDSSVQCIVTSPPYYGLRTYGTEPQVWGGDENCQHVWGTEHFLSNSAPRDHDGPNGFSESRGEEPHRANTTLKASTGQFCQRCGAWRGDLGLEPSPELYVQHLVEIFREVRRILRLDGTCYLNIGDSYVSSSTPETFWVLKQNLTEEDLYYVTVEIRKTLPNLWRACWRETSQRTMRSVLSEEC